MNLTASITSLQIGAARDVDPTGTNAWWDKEWRTGFYKQPCSGPQWLAYQGLRGDEQADRRVHGGVDKAVCVYAVEHYAYWRETLAKPDLPFGAFGENFTTAGLLETDVCIGDIFMIGEVRVQVSQPRQPCWKLARRWQIKDLTAQVERTGFTGFYFRVLHHGRVTAGDQLTLEARPHPDWSIARCNALMHHRTDARDEARELSAIPALSASWKDSMWLKATPRESVADPEEPKRARSDQP